MKKTLLLLFFIYTLVGRAQQTMTTSILSSGTPNFIYLVDIMDTLRVPDTGISVEDSVKFVEYNASDVIIDSSTYKATRGSGVWTYTLNTSNLWITSTHIVAHYYKAGILVDSSNRYDFNVLPKPEWLSNGGSCTIDSIIGDSVYMNAKYPLKMKDYAIPGKIPFISGRKFGFSNNGFIFKPTYDLVNTNGNVNPATSFSYTVKAFDYETNPITINTSTTSVNGLTLTLNVDSPGFNLGATARFTYKREILKWESPEFSFWVPASPFKVRFGAEFKLDGGIGGKLNYGKSGSNYGLIGSILDTNSSNIAAGVSLGATIFGAVDLVNKHIATAKADLTGIGRFGVDYRFVTIPSFKDTFIIGGDFKLIGTITISGFGYTAAKSFLSNLTGGYVHEGPSVFGSLTLWPRDQPSYPFGSGFPPILNMVGYRLINPVNQTFQAQWYNEMNYQDPDPDMDAKNANIKTVWIEEDTVAKKQYLLMAKYDSVSCGFLNVKTIVSETHSISNPKISSFSNGDAIITWTQNRYSVGDTVSLPHDSTLMETYMDGQNIWYAIYQNSNDSVVYRDTLNDNTYNSNAIAEGEAAVTAGPGNDAIISWSVEDPAANTTDIYYVNINNTSGNWTMTSPAKIVDLAGNNFKAEVRFVDNTNAVAVWINDVDHEDTTANNQIVSYIWSVTTPTWTPLSPEVAPSKPNTNYEAVSFDVNNGYALVAYTAVNYVDTGIVSKTVEAKIYDNVNDVWPAVSTILDTDTITDFNLPSVSVSDSGIVAISYQSINRFTDTIPDQGQLNLLVCNLANPTVWKAITKSDLKFLCDTNTFVWQMSTAFGKNGVLNILTQESDTVAGQFLAPNNGMVFGNQNLGLIMRNVQVYPDLSIIDAPVPCNNTTGVSQLNKYKENTSITIANYPNPANEYTIFDYVLKESSNIKMEIFDLQGNLVDTPINQFLYLGKYKTIYNTNKLANGVYMYKVTMDNYSVTKKLVIAK